MTEVVCRLPEKLIPVFQGPADVRGAYGGRGSAKTRSFAAMACHAGMRFGQAGISGLILCARQYMNSLADSSLEEIKRAIDDNPTLSRYYEYGERYVRSRDGRIEFVFAGLHHGIDSIKSKGRILLCWVDEAEPVTDHAWKVLIPTLREEGDDWNAELWVTWNPELEGAPVEVRFVNNPDPLVKVVKLNYRDNKKFPAKLERARQRDLASLPKDEYEWIWEGKTRKTVVGAIYADEVAAMVDQGRACDVAYDPAFKVHVIWDLGWNDSMSLVLVQRHLSTLRVIEYLEDSHKTLDWWSAELKRRSYNWGKLWLPHDGAHGDYKTGKSARQIMEDLGWEVEITPNQPVETGIRTARMSLAQTYIDRTRAARLLECLKRYRRGVPASTGEPGHPVHDEWSHGADAYRYTAINAEQLTNETWGFGSKKINPPNLALA